MQLIDHIIPLFAPLARARTEAVAVAFFDRDGRLLGMRHCPSDSFTAVEVPIRAIAADALAFEAHHVVMAHNHPSGDPEPSREDLAVTRRIAAALAALGVRLVDHLVLAGDTVTSFRSRGLL